MRLAENVAGTRKAATEILQLCFDAKDWKLLNEQILNLSKKRGQLKQVLGILVISYQCLWFKLLRNMNFWFGIIWRICLSWIFCLSFECDLFHIWLRNCIGLVFGNPNLGKRLRTLAQIQEDSTLCWIQASFCGMLSCDRLLLRFLSMILIDSLLTQILKLNWVIADSDVCI